MSLVTSYDPVPMCPPEAFAVTGIWYSSTTHGVITIGGAFAGPVVQGSVTVATGPGAVIAMTGPNTQGALLFDGANNAATKNSGRYLPMLGLTKSYYGSTPGIIALTERDALVQSVDNGTTFALSQSGIAASSPDDVFLWLSQSTSGTWFAGTQSSLGQESLGAGPNTAPSQTLSNPTWPSPTFPVSDNNSDTCIIADWWAENGTPPGNPNMWASPDGNTVIFTTPGLTRQGTETPGVCRSTNAGVDFNLVASPNLPADEANDPVAPGFVVFHDASNGIAAGPGDSQHGAHVPFAYTTANGGASWTAATTLPQPPAFGNASGYVFTNAFYAQSDPTRVWIVGSYNPSPTGAAVATPVLWRSTDGGHTFTDESSSLASWIAAQPASTPVIVEGIVSGFALDDTNVWLGGLLQHEQNGTLAGDHTAFLLYSSTGGQ